MLGKINYLIHDETIKPTPEATIPGWKSLLLTAQKEPR